MLAVPSSVRQFLYNALQEDIGPGDLTTLYTVEPTRVGRGIIKAEEHLVVAGTLFVTEVFRALDAESGIEYHCRDGEEVQPGSVLMVVEGRMRELLSGERVALNILQRLSGIATLTRQFVNALEDTGVTLLDTRKTTPGMRYLEKYAVQVGGGRNHRFGLFDGILIKDNHITAAGGIGPAIRRVREHTHHLLKVEVEVGSLEELDEALQEGADMVMLDNFSPQEVQQAVSIVRDRGRGVEIEVSGGITLENIREYALEGVNYISTGSITHSARAVDISMDIHE